MHENVGAPVQRGHFRSWQGDPLKTSGQELCGKFVDLIADRPVARDDEVGTGTFATASTPSATFLLGISALTIRTIGPFPEGRTFHVRTVPGETGPGQRHSE